MRKALLYRMFGLGRIPRRIRRSLEKEGMIVCDEGMRGRQVMRNVRGPGRRHVRHSQGFSAALAVTRQRMMCYTCWKRRMNVAAGDARIGRLHVDCPDADTLSITFESGDFQESWQGVIEFRFRTDTAFRFRDALVSLGLTQGSLAGHDEVGR